MDERETPTLEWIRHNLDRLVSLDQHYWVFGAQEHRYRSNRLSNDEIISLEYRLGVRLPEDYRQFLLEIGYGAGPYCGLLSPHEILDELRMENIHWQKPLLPAPGQPFPIKHEQAEECYKLMGEGRNAVYETAWPTDGCIPICYEGCTF